jgi:hypothetical protein
MGPAEKINDAILAPSQTQLVGTHVLGTHGEGPCYHLARGWLA